VFPNVKEGNDGEPRVGAKYEELGRLVAEDVRADPKASIYMQRMARVGLKSRSSKIWARAWPIAKEATIYVGRCSMSGRLRSRTNVGPLFITSFPMANFREATDLKESSLDRRERAIRERFGNEAVDYSDT
jgi:hypothetical protein